MAWVAQFHKETCPVAMNSPRMMTQKMLHYHPSSHTNHPISLHVSSLVIIHFPFHQADAIMSRRPWCRHLADSLDTSPCPAYIFSSSRTGAAARETRAPRNQGSPVKSALRGYHQRHIGCKRCPMNSGNNHTTCRSGPPVTKNVAYSRDTHQQRLCARHPGNAALEEGDSKQREQLLAEDNFHKTMSIFNVACMTHVQQGSYPPVQSL